MACGLRRILVVDDNPDLLYTVRVYLTVHGHAVWAQTEAQAGLRCISTEHPDIVFSELDLPRLDGYYLAKNVRTEFEFLNIRLIALTANTDPDCLRRAQDAGFETTLVKPVPLDEMLRLVEMPSSSPKGRTMRAPETEQLGSRAQSFQ